MLLRLFGLGLLSILCLLREATFPDLFINFIEAIFLGIIPVPILVLLGVGIIYFILSRLKVYKHIYAVGGKEEAAWASGIKVHATKIKAFLWSGVFVALAAICLVSETATGDARCGLGYTLNSVAAAVIGGISFSGRQGVVWPVPLWEARYWDF